jgi:hypothetical protein
MEKNMALSKDINFILSSLGVSLSSEDKWGLGPHTIRIISVYEEQMWRGNRHLFNIEVTVNKDSNYAPSKKPSNNSWTYSKRRVMYFNRSAKDAAQYSFDCIIGKDDTRDMLKCLGINIGCECINKVTFKEK